MTNLVAIGNIEIQQDEAGRYSLNDLHRASGGEKRHQPSNWLAIQQVQEFIKELENEILTQENLTPGIPGVKNPINQQQGRYGGTFVVKELVYSYAMWVSPKFQLKVIRVFDSFRVDMEYISSLEHRISQLEQLVSPVKSLVQIGKTAGIPSYSEESFNKLKEILNDTDYFIFSEVFNELNCYCSVEYWQLRSMLRDLGYTKRCRRRIRGDRQTLWSKRDYWANDDLLTNILHLDSGAKLLFC